MATLRLILAHIARTADLAAQVRVRIPTVGDGATGARGVATFASGARRPVTRGEATRTTQVTTVASSRAAAETLAGWVDEEVLYRDNHGHLVYGLLAAVNRTNQAARPDGAQLLLTIVETDQP